MEKTIRTDDKVESETKKSKQFSMDTKATKDIVVLFLFTLFMAKTINEGATITEDITTNIRVNASPSVRATRIILVIDTDVEEKESNQKKPSVAENGMQKKVHKIFTENSV